MITLANMSEIGGDVLYERGSAVFQPDTLLASQYFDRVRQRRGGHSGEWALVVAIIEDAVDVYLKLAAATEPHSRRLFEEAEQWIEDHDSTWIFSFSNICDLLGLDQEYLRGGLRTAKARARQARRSQTDGAVTIAVEGEEPRRQASGE